LKPSPNRDGGPFLLFRRRRSFLLLFRIQGVERLANDFIRRAVTCPGDFLLDACIQVGRERDWYEKNISSREDSVERKT
jgi:hypothetical protein